MRVGNEMRVGVTPQGGEQGPLAAPLSHAQGVGSVSGWSGVCAELRVALRRFARLDFRCLTAYLEV
jgi:hypothetical protein